MGALDGKVAVVTGAAKGIGRASALVFSREGASVVVADVDADGGHETVSMVEAAGGQASFVRADVSIKADVYYCLKAEIPRMLERGGGAIVNTASGVGLIGYPEQSAYTASKHGVIGLTKVAALDYGAKGVRVNAICPGTARTPMVDDAVRGDPSLDAHLKTLHPIGRIGEASEIAEAAVWLCTPAASFVLGVALPVDGGYVIP